MEKKEEKWELSLVFYTKEDARIYTLNHLLLVNNSGIHKNKGGMWQNTLFFNTKDQARKRFLHYSTNYLQNIHHIKKESVLFSLSLKTKIKYEPFYVGTESK